jgi:predicted DNA-binding protein
MDNYYKPKNKPMSKMVSFRLPIGYLQMLQRIADETGKSKSAIVRQGLDVLNEQRNK